MASVRNVDKIILINDYLKEFAIKDNIPESKLLALGSPKIDSLINNLNNDEEYPREWKEKLEGKKVYLLETGCTYFINEPYKKIQELANILNITNINKNTAIIWRPHPLTKSAIKRYIPSLLDFYNKLTQIDIKGNNRLYNNVIFDETDNYMNAIKASDVLISGVSSILGAYLLTDKKIIFLGKDIPKGSLVPRDNFYYFYNKEESWFNLIEKINKDDTPVLENRKEIVNKIYKNIDGTSGEKIYKSVKVCLITESKK